MTRRPGIIRRILRRLNPLRSLLDKIECLECEIQDLQGAMDDKVEQSDVDDAIEELEGGLKQDIGELERQVEELERQTDDLGGQLDDMNDHAGRIDDLESSLQDSY